MSFTALMLGLAQIALIPFLVFFVRAVRSRRRKAIGQSLIWLGPYAVSMGSVAMWLISPH